MHQSGSSLIFNLNNKMNIYTSYHPTKLIVGVGAIDKLTEEVSRMGKNVLLVRTPVIPPMKLIYEKVETAIKASGNNLFCFDEVKPNPTTEIVTQAAEIAIANNVDLIVALGGGSSIDTAKAVAIEVAYKRPCWDFRFGSGLEPGPETLPVIAIPTTSGTGSEVTSVAVVSNEAENYKSIIVSTHILCKVAIIDSQVTITMPRKLTAETGFDAFAHCFEAYINKYATPIASIYALEGMRLVAKSLVKACDDPLSESARADMSLAATLGGMALAETNVTLPHGMGMAIGGFCHSISHGASMAVVYPEILARSTSEGGERYATVARLFRPELKANAEVQLPEIIAELLEQIGLNCRMKEYGIDDSLIIPIADACMEQPGWEMHPKIHTRDEVIDILQKCL